MSCTGLEFQESLTPLLLAGPSGEWRGHGEARGARQADMWCSDVVC